MRTNSSVNFHARCLIRLDTVRSEVQLRDHGSGEVLTRYPLMVTSGQKEEIDFEDEIAIDQSNSAPVGWLYYASNVGKYINRLRVNGSAQGGAFVRDWISPLQIALDSGAQKMYWTDHGARDGLNGIIRTNLDGSDKEQLVESNFPFSIDIDPIGGRLFWSDSVKGGSVYGANLDGTMIDTLHTRWEEERGVIGGHHSFSWHIYPSSGEPGIPSPQAPYLAYDQTDRKLYWVTLTWDPGRGKHGRN